MRGVGSWLKESCVNCSKGCWVVNRVWLATALLVLEIVGSWRMRVVELVAAMVNKVWDFRLVRRRTGKLHACKGQSPAKRLTGQLDRKSDVSTMG